MGNGVHQVMVTSMQHSLVQGSWKSLYPKATSMHLFPTVTTLEQLWIWVCWVSLHPQMHQWLWKFVCEGKMIKRAVTLIVNDKKMDPSSKENPGPKVYQLETAMGAAISSLPGSQAIVVPFHRFAPVKTCNQLFGLRSDAYTISEDFTPVLAPGACKPVIKFDGNYKMVPDMEASVPDGVPSLRECKKLTVKGKILFAPDTVIKGEVTIVNNSDERKMVGGEIVDTTLEV